MFEIIREKLAPEEECNYLPGRRATMRYRLIDGCSTETYERMLERGWRRFGRAFFRPACVGCEECRSLRIDAGGFRPNRSMRRALQRNQGLEVVLRPASISDVHLDLYHRYHADMAARKGWSARQISPLDYYHSFVEGREGFGHELLYFDGERLVGVAHADLLPRAVSAVYCYYDPELRRRSLGVFSILKHVDLARARAVPYVYLGYWVAGNASMSYKANYRPHEVLEGRPELGEEPVWRPPSRDPSPVRTPGAKRVRSRPRDHGVADEASR